MELNVDNQTHAHASTSMKMVLLLFAVALLATLSYFVYQENITPWGSGEEVASKVKSSSTSSWKTYTNAECGISLKYPKTWTVNSDFTATSTFQPTLHLTMYSADNAPKANTDMPGSLWATCYSSAAKMDTDNLGVTTLSQYLTKYSAVTEPSITKVTSAKVGAVTGYTAETGASQLHAGNYYYAEKNGKVVVFWIFDNSDATVSKQIVDTFRFTN